MSIKIFLVLIISSFLYSNVISTKIEEVEYNFSVDIMGTIESTINIKVNRKKGISAEYQKFQTEVATYNENNSEKNKLKKYEIKCQDIGFSSIDDIFAVIDKITFPEETNFINNMIADAPVWNIIVDGKRYFGNTNPDFYKEIMEKAKFTEITNYCIKNY